MRGDPAGELCEAAGRLEPAVPAAQAGILLVWLEVHGEPGCQMPSSSSSPGSVHSWRVMSYWKADPASQSWVLHWNRSMSPSAARSVPGGPFGGVEAGHGRDG